MNNQLTLPPFREDISLIELINNYHSFYYILMSRLEKAFQQYKDGE